MLIRRRRIQHPIWICWLSIQPMLDFGTLKPRFLRGRRVQGDTAKEGLTMHDDWSYAVPVAKLIKNHHTEGHVSV